MNDWQKQRFVERMISGMFNTVSGKRLAIFGFAFKKDTGDTRETPAIDVCDGLIKDGAKLAIYDPKVLWLAPCWCDVQIMRGLFGKGVPNSCKILLELVGATSARVLTLDSGGSNTEPSGSVEWGIGRVRAKACVTKRDSGGLRHERR